MIKNLLKKLNKEILLKKTNSPSKSNFQICYKMKFNRQQINKFNQIIVMTKKILKKK